MKPYYQDDAVTIYHGDCAEVLADMEAVNIVVTSPPYNVGLKYKSYKDDVPEEEFRRRIRTWFRLVTDACADGSRQYVVVSDTMIWWIRGELESCGLQFVQLLPWCKPNMASGGSRISSDWNNMTEWVMLFRKGKRTPMINGQGVTFNYLVLTPPQRNFSGDLHKHHVAQFPLELPLRLISRTPGEVVLDPFMGSGTTLLAAKRLGRHSIGIDTDEEYCEIAARRCGQAVLPFKHSGDTGQQTLII